MAAEPRPLRVLVVEDDAVIRETLREVLDDEGFATEGAGSLDEARAAIATSCPAVLILDLMLRDQTSEPLLRDLAAAADAPPTILMSAAWDAARIAGAHGVPLLGKPFDLDEALALVRRVLHDRARPRR